MDELAGAVRVLGAGVPGGPLAVLVHGLEDSWQSWRAVAARLDPAWRVVALDLPWRAGNDYRWRRGRPARAWLAAALDLVGARPDLVVAHSFGANATLELVAGGAAPRRGAVLLCPLYRPPELPVTWRVFERSRSGFVRHVRDGVRARLGRRAEVMDAELLEVVTAKAVDRIGPGGFLTVFEHFVASGGLTLSTVEVPVLVLAGAADHTLPRAAAAALARDMPAATVRVHEGYDHFCHVRRAGQVAADVSSFAMTAGLRPVPALEGEDR
ncbi:alpha/beta fold hydrolase [Micromonospora sp. CPCC 206061]|uniref:alpha/beta fold hydrolase n=1 Tax=Micromonospora sp. CPCC 206061 TaxID=3122410 RepID=UPI002FF273A0